MPYYMSGPNPMAPPALAELGHPGAEIVIEIADMIGIDCQRDGMDGIGIGIGAQQQRAVPLELISGY